MKRKELQKCAMCQKGVMHTGLPLFFVITIERFGINMDAVNRRAGLEMMMGGGNSGALMAEVMGPNEDLAKPVMEKKVLFICEACATAQRCVHEFAEMEQIPTVVKYEHHYPSEKSCEP